MKLIIDFDDTIFDTDRFKKERLFPCLKRYDISAELFEKSYEKYRKTNPIYDIYQHLESFGKESNTNIDLESIIYEISSGLESFVFPEYLSIFKKYGRENIFILTQGSENFQQLKIKRSEVDKKVGGILVVDSTKKEKIEDISLLWPNETILFIDDKFKNLSFETENKNIRRIFVGDGTNLTEEERAYLIKHEIPILKRENLEEKIISERENHEIESNPEFHFNKDRII